MFGNNKKNGRPTINIDTLIGASTTIRGDVSFSGGLHIEGKVHGSISALPDSEAVVVLSSNGMVEGELRAPHVIVNGELNGDVISSERVELSSQARVTGNIYYKLLEMHVGAQINGQMVRDDEPKKQLPKPVEQLVSA